MNKKILAILMALLMVAVSGVAMAEGTLSDPVISKTYQGEGRPAENFSFSISTEQVGIPSVTVGGSITFTGEKDEATKTTNFTVPTVGQGEGEYPEKPAEYIYTISETIPEKETAGINYATNSYTLKVTVYNDGTADNPQWKTAISIKDTDSNKQDKASFTNTYTAPQATDTNGTLTVKKVLAGKSANLSDTFSIKVTFTAEDGKVLNSEAKWAVADGSGITVTREGQSNVYIISGIGHNGEVKFYNLPIGTKYEVEETNKTGASGTVYTDSYDENNAGTLVATAASTTTVTNTSDITPDTGVTTDSMPYIMLMAIVAIAAVAFVMKKRAAHE